MSKFAFSLLILLFVSFATNAQRSKSTLLPVAEAKRLANQCSRPSPEDFTDTWEPFKAQILEMEYRLNEISKLKAKSCCIKGARIEKPSDWYLQYAALIWKGKKVIYISAVSVEHPYDLVVDEKSKNFEMKPSDSWKTRATVVCEGGNSWGVIYEVDSHKFSNLAVNGVG